MAKIKITDNGVGHAPEILVDGRPVPADGLQRFKLERTAGSSLLTLYYIPTEVVEVDAVGGVEELR